MMVGEALAAALHGKRTLVDIPAQFAKRLDDRYLYSVSN